MEQSPARPLTQSRLDDASTKFATLSTGETDDPDSQALFSRALDIPEIATRARATQEPGLEGTLEHWARRSPMHAPAFDHASLALTSATDALNALYLLYVQARAIPTFATFPLIRQAAESGLLSRWLLSDPTPRGMLERGFAAEWRSLLERRTFLDNMIAAGAVEPALIPKLRQDVSDQYRAAVEKGRIHDLFQSNGKRKGDKELPLRMKVPTGTNLFAEVAGPTPFTDMRWLFNMLSGVAHGLAWANLAAAKHTIIREYLSPDEDGVPRRSAVVTSQSDPNAGTQLITLNIALAQVLGAIDRFNESRLLLAPAKSATMPSSDRPAR